jgi:hypothetical protein
MLTEMEGQEISGARRKGIVERLQEERESCLMKWRAIGIKYGSEWATQASYPELAQWGKAVRRQHLKLPEWEDDRLQELCNAYGAEFDHAAYVEGWLEAVKLFWQDVKAELKGGRDHRLGRGAE